MTRPHDEESWAAPVGGPDRHPHPDRLIRPAAQPPAPPAGAGVTPGFHHTAAKERILAPDVARGLMLLGIAVANATTAWLMFGSAPRDAGSNPADPFVTVINDVLVHTRGLPMFALLFGYGVGMLVMRESGRGTPWPGARGLLLRRYGALAMFGAVHAVLLFWGDILLLYALYGLVLTLMVPLRNRTLLWIAGVLGVLGIMFNIAFGAALEMFAGGAGMAGPGGFEDSGGTPFGSFGDGYVGRQLLMGLIAVVTVPIVFVGAGFQVFVLMLAGLVAARMRILEESDAHRKLLAIVAAVGVTAAVATGVPAGLSKLGVIDGPLWGGLTSAAGVFAGPGIVALIALACLPWQRRIRAAAREGRVLAPPLPLAMLQALGQRSMSGYVLQSVFFIVIAGSWFLDLFAGASVTAVSAMATGVWLVTVIGAWLLHTAGKPGPLEALHRRLTYGKGDTAP